MSIKEGLAGGSKSASFHNIGDSVEGTVLSSAIKQATDIKTKAPLTWDDGNPQMNFVFELQTSLRDPQIENDNGIRSVWMKVSGADKKAVKKAVMDAGVDDIYDGGYMKVTYVGDEPSSVPGFNPKKIKEVQYRPPQGAVGQAAEAPTQQNFQGQGQQNAQQGQGQPQGQQWGQNPQQAQQAPQGQPQQSQPAPQGNAQQNPWGNQAPQNVQQGQPQGSPWGNSDQGQQNNDGLKF